MAAPEVGETAKPSLQRALSNGEVRGKSIPSREINYKFAQPGLISELNVKDGDPVKEGQVMAKQDTAVEQAALEREQFELKSTVQKRAAVAQRELAAVEVKRQEIMLKSKSTSETEAERAKVELVIADLKIELADEDTQKKALDIAKIQKQIDRMQIVSKYNGVVRKVEESLGGVSDPQKPSIVAVVTDPLKVEVKMPTLMTTGMTLGQAMQVRYIEEKDKWREAKVIYFDPVADATTGTQLVHLELANPDGRRAGQEMAVKLPVNVAEAK